MGKFFMQVCRESGLKVQHQHLFDRLTLPEFLKGKVCFLNCILLILRKVLLQKYLNWKSYRGIQLSVVNRT